MLSYVFRRLGLAVLTLIVVTFLVYALIRNMPGDPMLMSEAAQSLDRKLDPEDLRKMRASYGLDKPWHLAYFIWLGNTLQGDLGISYARHKPVAEMIGERLPATLLLSVTSLLLTYLLSVPLGLYSTIRSGHLDERGVSTLLYMLYSLPSYVAALALQIIFAKYLRGTMLEMPLTGLVSGDYDQLSWWGQVRDIVWHSILPVVCYTYASLAYYSRFIRANMHEVIRQDYIRTARAKGAGPLRVLLVHAFRNTLIPLVTLIGLTLPALLSGSIILEQIFAWPGIGKLFFESVAQRDYRVMMGLMLMFSTMTLAGQLLADLLYAWVDPRVTYS